MVCSACMRVQTQSWSNYKKGICSEIPEEGTGKSNHPWEGTGNRRTPGLLILCLCVDHTTFCMCKEEEWAQASWPCPCQHISPDCDHGTEEVSSSTFPSHCWQCLECSIPIYGEGSTAFIPWHHVGDHAKEGQGLYTHSCSSPRILWPHGGIVYTGTTIKKVIQVGSNSPNKLDSEINVHSILKFHEWLPQIYQCLQ